MKKLFAGIVIACLVLSVITLPGCETFARAFADQAGRNAADILFGR
ncbi:MAG: hypothetical protein FWH19_02505 [Treponema sp.]|nr:hypothetical protein [Treponema sp.]